MTSDRRPQFRPVEIRPSAYGAGSLLSSVGRPSFEGELSRFVSSLLGPNELHLFRMEGDNPAMLASISSDGSNAAMEQSETYIQGRFWPFDEMLQGLASANSASPLMCRADTGHPGSREMRAYYEIADLRERVMVLGGGASSRMALAVVRRKRFGTFDHERTGLIDLLGSFAFSLMIWHFSMLSQRSDLPRALTCLATIEHCLSTAEEKFPKREAQVIARMLYGMSAEGVAIDLRIGLETVICYRRRFYRRLRISCFRELVVWYLDLFARRMSAPLLN